MMEQVMPELVKSFQSKASKTKKGDKGKPGRPSGSKNKNRSVVELSKYLQFVQATLKNLLNIINTDLSLVYFVFDGAFGKNEALQMVRQCELHLISKMRYDSARNDPYTGKYSGRGRQQKYAKRLNCRALPKKYQKSYSVDGDIRTCIYQVNVWHKLFADMLNVVIIVKTNLKTGKMAHVILFSSDLKLTYDKLVEYYQLRFQIEFNLGVSPLRFVMPNNFGD
jgi:putative transposase